MTKRVVPANEVYDRTKSEEEKHVNTTHFILGDHETRLPVCEKHLARLRRGNQYDQPF